MDKPQRSWQMPYSAGEFEHCLDAVGTVPLNLRRGLSICAANAAAGHRQNKVNAHITSEAAYPKALITEHVIGGEAICRAEQ